MLLVEEAIQRVQSMYSRGVQSQSTRLTSRHIYSCLLTARGTIISQKINKRQNISQWIYQTIPCIELIKVPVTECDCVISKGCFLLRSKYKIPKPLTSISGSAIQSVTTIDGMTRFDEISFHTRKFMAGNKYTSTQAAFYPKNGYLYLINRQELKAISLTQVCDDPIEAQIFPSFCDDTCKPCIDVLKLEFPIEKDSERGLIQLAQEEAILLFKQMSEDRKHDSSDNIESNMIHNTSNDN